MRKFSKLFAIAIMVMLVVTVFAACDNKQDGTTDDDKQPTTVYTVTFDSQGGNSVEARTSVAGGTIQAPTEPIRIGYKFVGWYTDSAGTGDAVSFPFTVNSNVVLYAKWTLHPLTSEAIDNYMNSEFGDSINGYYQKTVDITVATYDFGGLSVPAGVEGSKCYFGIYGSSDLDKSSILYVSDQTQWLTMFGAGSTSGAQKTPVFSLTKGNNYFYILFINYEDNSTKTYNFNIRQGSSYTVTFRNSDQNYYRVEVPFKGTVFDPNDVNNSRYAGKTYTVTDPNGEEIDVWDGILYEEDVPAEIEARAGYSFEYWYYYEDNQNKYSFKTNIEINSDMTLYAEWKAKSYTVELSPLGCDVLSHTSAKVTYGEGGTEFDVPQKYQAVFEGWYYGDRQITTADGRLLKVWDIDIDGITLTAKWRMNQYSVTLLNTNEGAGSIYLTDVDGNELGSAAKLDYGSLFDINVAPNNGYRFKGWTTAADTDKTVDPSTVVLAKDVTYYAQWEIVKYVLTFDVTKDWVNYNVTEVTDDAGNSGITETFDLVQIADSSAKLFDETGSEKQSPAAFVMSVERSTASYLATKKGYSFKGWFYVQGGKPYRVGDEEGHIDIESVYELKLGTEGEDQQVALIAGYSIESYGFNVSTTKTKTEEWINVKISTAKGEAFNGPLVAYKSAVQEGTVPSVFEYGTKIELSLAIPSEYDDIYKFEAWVNFFDNTPYSTTETYNWVLEDVLSIKAQFGTEKYNFVYGGTIIGTAEKGNTFSIDSYVKEREGYTFVGWKHDVVDGKLITDENGTGLEVFMFDSDSAGEEYGNHILVAPEYVANRYTVDVNVSDSEAGYGVLESSADREGEIVYDGSYTLTAVTNPGYTFKGWYRVVNGNRQERVSADAVYHVATVNTVQDLAFEAVWEANRYLVKLTAEGGDVKFYVAIFGKDYFLNITSRDELNSVKDEQANRVFKLDADTREFYEFVGWKYVKSNVYNLLTDADGEFETAKWNILSDVEVAPIWRSVYELGDDGSIVGLTDYGKENYTELYVPSTIEVTDEDKLTVTNVKITSVAAEAFADYTFITKVELSNDIVTIGENAFAGTVNLAEVVIGTQSEGVSLSKLAEVGANAFKNCTSLTSIAFPVTVEVYGDSVLAGCGALTDVTYNGNMAFGKLFGSESYNNSYSVIQNGNNYYVPSGLTTINVTAGISKIADYSFANLTLVQNINYPDTVCEIGTSAFENSGIVAFNFDNITYIGANAFSNTKLTEVVLSDKLEVLGSGAFSRCTELTSATIKHNPVEIQSGLFEDCTKLATVEGTESVRRIGKAAFKNTKLTAFAGASVETVGDYAFDGVNGLATAGFTKVTAIGVEAFEAFGTIGKVYYKAQDASSTIDDGVLYIAPQAFKGIAITSVTIPASVVEIGEGAFENCTSLTSVTFGGNDVKYILSRAFYGCSALGSFTVPESVVQIGYEAFASSGLTSVDLSAAKSLKVVGNKAFAWSKLTSVELPNSVRTLGTEAFKEVTTLASATLGSLTAIPDGTFYGCTSLVEFTVKENVASVGNKAFAESGITKVIVEGVDSDDDNSELVSIGEFAFENAVKFTGFVRNEYTANKEDADGKPIQKTDPETGDPMVDGEGNPVYETVTVSGGTFLPEKLVSIGQGAFRGNVSLTTVTATGIKSLSDDVFSGCENLANVNLGEVVEFGDYAFYNCKSLTDICYGTGDGASFNKFVTGLVSIGDSAFENCVNLFDQGIDGKLTSLVSIGNKAFYDNKLITAIEIPAKVATIGSQAFSGCSSVSSLTFGSGSALTTIGYEAFRGCRGITEVTFDDALTTIERDAFNGCSALSKVVFGKGISSVGARAFANIQNGAEVKFTGETAPILDSGAFDDGAKLMVKWLYVESYGKTAGWQNYTITSYIQ